MLAGSKGFIGLFEMLSLVVLIWNLFCKFLFSVLEFHLQVYLNIFLVKF